MIESFAHLKWFFVVVMAVGALDASAQEGPQTSPPRPPSVPPGESLEKFTELVDEEERHQEEITKDEQLRLDELAKRQEELRESQAELRKNTETIRGDLEEKLKSLQSVDKKISEIAERVAGLQSSQNRLRERTDGMLAEWQEQRRQVLRDTAAKGIAHAINASCKSIEHINHTVQSVNFDLKLAELHNFASNETNLWSDPDFQNGFDLVSAGLGGLAGAMLIGALVGPLVVEPVANQIPGIHDTQKLGVAIGSVGVLGTGSALAGTFAISSFLLSRYAGAEREDVLQEKIQFIEFSRRAYDQVRLRQSQIARYISENERFSTSLSVWAEAAKCGEAASVRAGASHKEKRRLTVQFVSLLDVYDEILKQVPAYLDSFLGVGLKIEVTESDEESLKEAVSGTDVGNMLFYSGEKKKLDKQTQIIRDKITEIEQRATNLKARYSEIIEPNRVVLRQLRLLLFAAHAREHPSAPEVRAPPLARVSSGRALPKVRGSGSAAPDENRR